MSMAAVMDEDDETFDLGRERMAAARAAISPEAGRADRAGGVRRREEPRVPARASSTSSPRHARSPRSSSASGQRPPSTSSCTCSATTASATTSPRPRRSSAPPAGDRDAIEEFLAALADYDVKQDAARRLLELGADAVKEVLLELLPRWYDEVFVPHSDGWREAAERDAEAKRKAAGSHTRRADGRARHQRLPVRARTRRAHARLLPELVDAALGDPLGAQEREDLLLPDPPGAGRRTGRRRPSSRGCTRRSGTRDGSGCCDGSRDGSLRLSEAAAELGVAKSTAHHHLAILRHAGLVTIRDEDENVYSLRRDTVPQAGALLESFLG